MRGRAAGGKAAAATELKSESEIAGVSGTRRDIGAYGQKASLRAKHARAFRMKDFAAGCGIHQNRDDENHP
jgi:hypothetical protein